MRRRDRNALLVTVVPPQRARSSPRRDACLMAALLAIGPTKAAAPTAMLRLRAAVVTAVESPGGASVMLWLSLEQQRVGRAARVLIPAARRGDPAAVRNVRPDTARNGARSPSGAGVQRRRSWAR